MITVKLLREGTEEQIPCEENLTVEDVLEKCKYTTETAVVQRDGKILTEDEVVDDNDTVQIIPVVSGG